MACYDIPERTNSVSSRNGDSLLDVASGTYELLLRFHADGLGAARWGASASVLPNLLPPRHGAASAYIPGIELPDELPSPTPDQVSYLPPATCHRRRRLLGNGVGVRSRAAPLTFAALHNVAAVQGAPERVG